MSNSPLAEKRLTISIMKKHLVGRRAYSDSLCKYKSSKASPGNSSSTSSSSSVCSSPRLDSQDGLLVEKAFGGIHAC